MRSFLMRLLAGLTAGVLVIYGFRAAPVTVGLVDDLRFVMPWLQEAWVSLACIAAASVIVTLLIAQPVFERVYGRRRLKIVFPNEANLDSKQSLFRVSQSLVSREPIPEVTRQISTHKIFVGVENLGGSFTARNARLCAVALYPLGTAVDITFASARSGGSKVDIQPGDTELFLVLVGQDEGRFTSNLRMLDPEHLRQACALLDEKPHERAHLVSHKGSSVKLLRNDGYVLELRAYADDARPAEAIAGINARNRIELFVYPSRLRMRIARYIAKTREKGYAVLCHARNLLLSLKLRNSVN